MLDGNILVAHFCRLLFGVDKRVVDISRNINALRRRGPAHLGNAADSGFEGGLQVLNRYSHIPDQFADQPVFLLQQGKQKMGLFELLVAVFNNKALCGLHRFDALLREFLRVHGCVPPSIVLQSL